MRPALAALAAQQRMIDSLVHQLDVQNRQLAWIGKVAGVSPHLAAIRKKADQENPAQPIPDPASEPPSETTEEALQAETNDDPQSLGETPGSVGGLPAETTTVPLAPGETLPAEPFNDLEDVTAPVAGTEVQLPLEQTKTETDVRVGDPDNPEPAFPWGLGGAPGAENDAVKTSNRTMASIRLAKLRLAAKTASGDELGIAAQIDGNKKLTNSMIGHEIQTLSSVLQAAGKNQRRPSNLVPRTASQTRSVPSMSGNAGLAPITAAVDDSDTEDADLFLGDL